MPSIGLPSGRTIYVEKHDRTLPSSAPDTPILFIHGMYQTCKSWEPILADFQDYTWIIYDVEPFGQSPATGLPLDMPSQAQTARDILAHFGYTTAHVAGHSAGCTIAVQLAHDSPASVRTLLLLAPLQLVFPRDWDLSWISLPLQERLPLWQSFAGPRAQKDPRFLHVLNDEVEKHMGITQEAYRYFQGIMDSTLEDAGGVDAWVLAGSEERTSGVDPKAVANTLRARCLTIEGAGHYVTFEEPKATADAMRTALESK